MPAKKRHKPLDPDRILDMAEACIADLGLEDWSMRGLAAQLHVEPMSRSEEHTSELQSRRDLVCRLLLEKKKKQLISLVPRQICIRTRLVELGWPVPTHQ